MSRNKKGTKEVIKIRLPGFEFISVNPTYKSIIALGLLLIFGLTVCMIFFFLLKIAFYISNGYPLA